MDFRRNVSVSGEFQQEQVLSSPCSKLGATLAATGSLDDLFPGQNTVSFLFLSLSHLLSKFLFLHGYPILDSPLFLLFYTHLQHLYNQMETEEKIL